jgi:hypothetical protein
VDLSVPGTARRRDNPKIRLLDPLRTGFDQYANVGHGSLFSCISKLNIAHFNIHELRVTQCMAHGA